MAFRSLSDVSYSDDEILDRIHGTPVPPPEYPYGLSFSISCDDLAKAGCEGGAPNDTCRFSAMGEVTSIFRGREDCRIELQVGEFAGEDGKFFDLSEPCYLSLTSSELDKMDLEDDCERGDLIHLEGEARLESHSSTEDGGDRCQLQVTKLGFVENESAESREG